MFQMRFFLEYLPWYKDVLSSAETSYALTRGGWVGGKVKSAGNAGFSTFLFPFKLCTVLFTNRSLSGEETEDNVATFKSLRFKRVFTTD